jgi:hypothetical protein
LFVNACAFFIIMFLSLNGGSVDPTNAPQVDPQSPDTTTTTTTTTTTSTTISGSDNLNGSKALSRARRSTDEAFTCDHQKIGTFWMALIWFILFSPASMLWYRSLYKAFRDDSSFQFFMFFFVYFFQLIFHIIQAIGAKGMGFGGWLEVFTLMGCNTFAGILMIGTAGLFTFNTVLCFMQIIRVHDVYKASGKTLAQAQSEWASGVISNPTVQSYAREAAGNVIQQEVNRTMGTH